MKIILVVVAMLSVAVGVRAQDAKTFYEQGVEKAVAGKVDEAIKLFDKTIELQPDNAYAWYNRGVAKSKLGLYEDAMPDFEKTVELAPDYKKGWLNRGLTKKRLTDYDGAIADYKQAIQLDAEYADAYYNRGAVYNMLGRKAEACADYQKAKELGLSNADRKVEICNDTTTGSIPITPILRLSRNASNRKYGFTEDHPVKAGTGPEGGPANQRAYLELLRDMQGKPVKYSRISSCCHYKSKHGLIGGLGMLDQYEIIFLNEKGHEEKAIVYISFYDYEEPRILHGFRTVGQK